MEVEKKLMEKMFTRGTEVEGSVEAGEFKSGRVEVHVFF